MSKYADKNISPGGHIYDRTTGTWSGEGNAALAALASTGIGTRVLHDANGVVGLQLMSPVREAAATSRPARENYGDPRLNYGWKPGDFDGGLVFGDPTLNYGANEAPKKPAGAVVAPGSAVQAGATGGTNAVITAENRGAFIPSFVRGWDFSGKDDPVQDAIFAGKHWAANPKFTNGSWVEERYGDSELIQTVVGLGIFGADLGFNAAKFVWGPNVQQMGPQERLAALGAGASKKVPEMVQGGIDGMFSFGHAIQGAAAQAAAHDAVVQAQRDAFNDAWDLRELLQQQEANAHKDRQVQEKWRLEEVMQDALARGPAPLP